MNLIEISNQLKDVPDQFLMKEVQSPSGAYPSYLVISELTRRKRMRESALKEAPQTTVAQDLADPGREQRQMAMAQAAQQMAAPSLNAGLAAAPQAIQSLAAQDAMGTTPPEMMMPAQGMAAGGMVSFKHGGEVPRFQNEGYVSDPMFGQSDFVDQGFTGRGLSEVMDLAQQSEKDQLVSRMTLPELQEFNRSGRVPERLRSSPTTARATSEAPEAPPSPAAAPAAAPAIPPFTMAPYKPRTPCGGSCNTAVCYGSV